VVELRSHSASQILFEREVTVVSAQSSGKLPHPLYDVEFRAIGWKKKELQVPLVFSQPGLYELGVVPAGIVQDHYHFPQRWTVAKQTPEEPKEGLGIEGSLLLGEEVPVTNAHRPQEAHILPRRGMHHNGVSILMRDPHGATTSVLLEMTFVLKPQIDVTACGQAVEFF
jgi:hypothetical protein